MAPETFPGVAKAAGIVKPMQSAAMPATMIERIVIELPLFLRCDLETLRPPIEVR